MKTNRTSTTDATADQTDDQTQPPADQTSDTGTPATPPTPRPAPKRKFAIRLGTLNFEKRCTVEEMAATIAATQGAKAYLEIDGYSFEFREEAVTTPDPALSL